MNIYILRHAIAVERGTHGYKNDSKRPLTPEGRVKMTRNARGMNSLGLRFDAVLSSPYVRALDTAVIAAVETGFRPDAIHTTRHLTPDAPYEALTAEIQELFADARNILLVGHEPHLSGLVSFLLTGGRELPMTFKKGGLCALHCRAIPSQAKATLLWFLTPAQLRAVR